MTVNGVPAVLGQKADPSVDTIAVNGRPILSERKKLYVMLNKPAGVVTTLHDEQGRHSVPELIRGVPERVYPVGRLDMYSEGLLLLTNDGELANALMHPGCEVGKKYLLHVKGENIPSRLRSLSAPMMIDGRMTSPAKVEIISQSDGEAEISVTIHEGRNRQIRRLCERAGLKVIRLCRVSEGPLALGDLPSGKWRYLTEDETAALVRSVQKGQTEK